MDVCDEKATVLSRSMMIKGKEHPFECVWFIVWPARLCFSLSFRLLLLLRFFSLFFRVMYCGTCQVTFVVLQTHVADCLDHIP